MPPNEPAQILALSSGVELGHAWIQDLADELDVRVLFLKGPTLTRQGLRAPRTSSDIDVLVDPAGFDRLCDAVLERGWQERPLSLIAELVSVHSRTFLHARWPCDIDVHRHYPGMLADPAEAFEALWDNREVATFAHRACAVPRRTANVLVLALHSLRGTERQSRHAAELDDLERVPLTETERRHLGELAARTGTTVTLFDVLARLGVTVTADPDERESLQARRWRERVSSGSFGSYFWFAVLRDARGIDRVRIAGRAVWPTRTDLLLSRPETVDTISGRASARASRWMRGVRSLPRALRAIRQNRRPTSIDTGEPRWN